MEHQVPGGYFKKLRETSTETRGGTLRTKQIQKVQYYGFEVTKCRESLTSTSLIDLVGDLNKKSGIAQELDDKADQAWMRYQGAKDAVEKLSKANKANVDWTRNMQTAQKGGHDARHLYEESIE